MLELVATRAIASGEEVVLDYGLPWVETWLQHVRGWRPPSGSENYAPSYVLNDAIQVLRTEEELKDYPYPPNVYTACYYIYREQDDTANRNSNTATTAVRWVMQRGMFEPRHLRPCRVLQRHEQQQKNQLFFTVQMRNRPGAPSQLPSVHIVTNVPRHAITFLDRLHTTDAHLPGTFRYPRGNLAFPEGWKDLKSTTHT